MGKYPVASGEEELNSGDVIFYHPYRNTKSDTAADVSIAGGISIQTHKSSEGSTTTLTDIANEGKATKPDATAQNITSSPKDNVM